jgi:hypothetical protein
MRKFLVAVLLALPAAPAAAFPVELERRTGQLEIGAVALSDGRMAIVQVSNREPAAVHCEALFRNGPEQGRSRRVTLAPGEEAALSWMPRRTVVRLRIELSCAVVD